MSIYREVKEALTNKFEQSMAPVLGGTTRWNKGKHGTLHPVDRRKLTLIESGDIYRLFHIEVEGVNLLIYKHDHLSPNEATDLFKAWAASFNQELDEQI